MAADISAILNPLARQLLEAVGTYRQSHPLESLVSKYLPLPCSGQGVDLDEAWFGRLTGKQKVSDEQQTHQNPPRWGFWGCLCC